MRPDRVTVVLVAVLLAACVAHGPAPGAIAPAGGATQAAPAGGRPPGAKRDLNLVYGDDHAFAVIPPQGWVLDDSSGLGSRIRVVLYPRGQKWDKSPVVMYANPLHQDPRAPKSLLQMVGQDIAAFFKNSPHGKVSPMPNVHAGGGREALVRYFAPDGREPVTAVAYLEEKDLVMLLVLDARNPAAFKGALPAFHDLVGSYQFVAANIHTPTRPGKAR